MMKDFVSLIRKKKYGKAKRYLLQELSQKADDVYLLTQMSNVMWNLGKEEDALYYADKAQERDSTYPLMLFTKGRVLWSLDRFVESITIWDKLLSANLSDIAERGWGYRWAKSVINDARFYKADCLYCLHHVKEAKLLIEEHLSNRQKGQSSDFTIREAKEFLRVLIYSRGDSILHEQEKTGWASSKQWEQIEKMMNKKKGDKYALVVYIKKKSREFPFEYYLQTLLAENLIDLGLYKESLRYARNAYEQEPTDVLVLYDYGNALFHNRMFKEAICVLETIIKTDINYIAYGEQGEGMRWAKKLLRDTRKLVELCNKQIRIVIDGSGTSQAVGPNNL